MAVRFEQSKSPVCGMGGGGENILISGYYRVQGGVFIV